MSRSVQCVVLKKTLPGLPVPPYPGEMGRKIFENVSAQAWQDWLRHQTMLINENRLTPINPEHRRFLEAEMDKFLFGPGSSAPAGYVPQDPV